MTAHPKVAPQHLERLACVYIRQSSPHQVEEHLESQDLQYQLAQRAQRLGWPESHIRLLDDDLGKSAVTTEGRQGFQDLVAAIGLNRVGIVLVTNVSRLARNCGDWYQLLDLAALCGTLIADASDVYDPRIYNDRMLLGLKGFFSEADWHHRRTQLYAALLNKARRGELAIRLPVGFERLEDGSVVMLPDREVQQAIQLVFAKFERLGSARAVLRYFREHGLQVPRQTHTGPQRGMVQWGKPSYSAIYQMLKHPAYAGAYSYGKHHNVRLPGAGRKVVTRKLPMDEWPVLIQVAFPGYITWEQYVQNQKQLKQNAQGVFQSQGAPRRGAALLQGLVLCAHCGRRMQVVYNRSPAYVCRQARHQYDAPNCQYFTAPYVDAAVTAVFLQAIEPARLEAALAAVDDIEAERRQLAAQWQSRLERARYQANLARRRYQQVDPDNRLVAAELERRWEEKLQTVAQLEQEWSEGQSQAISPLSASDKTLIRHLAADLPALWHADTTSNQERKRLLRGLIQDVTLDSVTEPDKSLIHIRWHTGANTLVKAHRPKPGRRTNHALLARIRELAQHHPDDQIAGILNAEGVRTYTGLLWTRERVFGVRRKNGIPTACPYRPDDPGPRGDGLIPVKEAVQRLGVAPSVIGDWFRRGLLAGHQRRPGSPLWVRVSAADLPRLDGSATLSPEMIPLPEAPKRLEMTQEQFLQALRSGQWLAYRLRIENRWRWYVWPPSQQSSRLSEAH